MSSSHAQGILGEGLARPNLDAKPNIVKVIVFVGLLVAGLIYTAFSISHDV